MIARQNGRLYDCVVVDVDTQRDFCESDGAYPVVNAHELRPALRQVVAWAKRNITPVISSIESHRPCEASTNGSLRVCVDGSDGQRKIDFTLFRGCTQIEVDNTLDCPIEIFHTHQQVIFRKRTNDLLSNPKADRLFTQVPTREFILFGIGLETSIKALALSLLAREKKVTVLVDACGYWSRGTADLALRLLVAKGCGMLSVSELLQRKLDRTQCFRARSNGRNGSSNGFRAGHLSGRNGSGRNGSTPKPLL